MPDSVAKVVGADLRADFAHGLAEAGFTLAGDPTEVNRWHGKITVDWEESATRASCRSDHNVEVELPTGFPFRQPTVRPLDDPPISGSRHQAPGEGGALCLWPEDNPGWVPWMGAEGLLARVETWFRHHHRSDWPPYDQPPDLHLYFPTEGPQPQMLIGKGWAPPIEAAAGRFAVRQRDDQRAFAEAPGAGSCKTENPPPDRILVHVGLDAVRPSQIGVWFRLRREPRPYPALGPLLDDIDAAAGEACGWALTQLTGLLGNKVRPGQGTAVLSLGYPDQGGEQWLFLRVDIVGPGKRTYWRRDSVLAALPLRAFETVRVDPSSLMRRTGHVAQGLDCKQVLVFGQGAIGSTVSLQLAKAGVPRIRLIDDDRLRPGNAVRHVAGIYGTGERKSALMKSEILRHVPDCAVAVEEQTWDIQQLSAWISESNVVLDATANEPFSLLLNDLCLRAGRPVVFAAAHRRAAVGRIRVVRPGMDACLVCHQFGYAHPEEPHYDLDYPLVPLGDEGAFTEAGCGTPTVEASAVDVEAVANWAARSVLWLLLGKLGDDNLCVIVNDVLPGVQGSLTDVGVKWERWAPIPGCESCGTAPEIAASSG